MAQLSGGQNMVRDKCAPYLPHLPVGRVILATFQTIKQNQLLATPPTRGSPPGTRKTPTVLVGALLTAVAGTAGWVGAKARRAGSCIRSFFLTPDRDPAATIPRPFRGAFMAPIQRRAWPLISQSRRAIMPP